MNEVASRAGEYKRLKSQDFVLILWRNIETGAHIIEWNVTEIARYPWCTSNTHRVLAESGLTEEWDIAITI